MKAILCVLVSMAWLMALPISAHHSNAMFDNTKELTLTGTVREFQMTNPHCWIQVLVPSEGGTVEWSVEMGSPRQLLRNGWKPGSLKAGAAVTVVIHPMRDGSKAGGFVSATGADGKPIGKQPGDVQSAPGLQSTASK